MRYMKYSITRELKQGKASGGNLQMIQLVVLDEYPTMKCLIIGIIKNFVYLKV